MAFRHVYSVGTVAKAVADKSAKKAYNALIYKIMAKEAKTSKAKASKAKAQTQKQTIGESGKAMSPFPHNIKGGEK